MKKIIAMLLVVFMILPVCAISFAEDSIDGWIKKPIEEIDAYVCFPSDYIIFTRGMDDSDPALVQNGLTPSYIDELFDSGNYCFISYSADNSICFYSTVLSGSFDDFSTYSDLTLLRYANELKNTFASYGITIIETEVYRTGDVKYMCFHEKITPDDGSIAYQMQYYTVIDGKAINFVMSSSDDELTDEEDLLSRLMIYHIEFGIDESTSSSAESAGLRTYTLEDGPFDVVLDETKYNIITIGMDEDEPAIIRSGLTSEEADLYLSVPGYNLVMFDINETLYADFKIFIRIKDKKYEEVDLRDYSFEESSELLDAIYSSFTMYGTSDKEIVTVNGVPYLKFDWYSGLEQRYGTIINGDMVYIFAQRENGELTEEDKALLLQVVEAISYPANN